jgi:beta-fructofuranosidase
MLRLTDSWVWDFWIIREQETYHIFFLYASRALHDPETGHRRASVGHAVSTDLVHWQRVADAVVHGSQPSFDQTATWTGSVVQVEDGRWYMFYTGATVTDEGQLLQQIGLAISDDLSTWYKHDRNPQVTPTPAGTRRSADPTRRGFGSCSARPGRGCAGVRRPSRNGPPRSPACSGGRRRQVRRSPE